MPRTVEAHFSDVAGEFRELTSGFAWNYRATSPEGEDYEVSAIYQRDFPPRAEVSITKAGEEVEPYRLQDVSNLGAGEDMVKSSLAEIAERCVLAVESGQDTSQIDRLLGEAPTEEA